MKTEWIKLTDRMPNPDEHDRVLIYTEGCDFNGEQVFDVKAETLNECFYADPDDQPEVCRLASHWAPHPAYGDGATRFEGSAITYRSNAMKPIFVEVPTKFRPMQGFEIRADFTVDDFELLEAPILLPRGSTSPRQPVGPSIVVLYGHVVRPGY